MLIASTRDGSMEENTLSLKEIVWKQLLDYIESEDLFFPFKIRKKVSEDAHETFEEFLELMLEKKMLIEFRKKSIFNRIALWIFKRKMKDREDKDQITQIYVKGPAWETYKSSTYAEVAGLADLDNKEIVH